MPLQIFQPTELFTSNIRQLPLLNMNNSLSMNRLEWGLLGLLSLLLACTGLIQDSDQISIWIIHFIDSLPTEDFWKPYRLPPPANGEYGFRPLSVLLMKLYLFFFEVEETIPRSVIFLKTGLSTFLFSWASFCWIRTQTTRRKHENLIVKKVIRSSASLMSAGGMRYFRVSLPRVGSDRYASLVSQPSFGRGERR